MESKQVNKKQVNKITEKQASIWCWCLSQTQGWTLALARSPRRVSKVSGECKSQITRPFGECDFSLPRNWLNCKINDVFNILFCQQISKHKLTIVHICMAKFYTPNCPKNGRWIDHFRTTFGLFFKASLGAHPFIWKLVFIHMQMKTNFHMKRWAPGLALKKRPKVIRKWPIATSGFAK